MPPSREYIDLTADDDDDHLPVATGAKRLGVQDGTLPAQTAKKLRLQPLKSGSDNYQPIASGSNSSQPVASSSNMSASAGPSVLASSSETASDGDQPLTLSERHERLRRHLEASIAIARSIAEESHVPKGVKSQEFAQDLSKTIECGVCYEFLWTPFALNCGHCFCSGCIIASFTAQKQAYDDGFDGHVQDELHNILPLELRRRLDQPPYRCPVCKQPAPYRPVEIFLFKSVIRALAHAGNFRVPAEHDEGDGEKRAARRAGLFEDFFASPDEVHMAHALTVKQLSCLP